MEPFERVQGVAAPLPAANIDTDVIMPKQFLKGIDRSGLDVGVFHALRFDPAGRPRPDFILNQPAWAGARFLVVGPNFGCGSSREHAVWGLTQLGIRALIGTSFAGIFNDNCINNGLLTVTLPQPEIETLLHLAAQPATNRLAVDLPEQVIRAAGGEGRPAVFPFEIEPLVKERLIHGLDAIGATLRHAEDIRGFERDYGRNRPWLGLGG